MSEDLKILAEEIIDHCNAQEAAYVKLRVQVEKLFGPKVSAAVKEETFLILNWEPQEGAKIGKYDVAYKANNIPDKWNSVHNILRQNNATITNRYHGQGYAHSYWLYGEAKIYRQKLKPQ